MPWDDRDYYRQEARHSLRGELVGASVVVWLLSLNVAVAIADYIFTGSQRGNWAAPSQYLYFTVDKAVYGLQLWRWITYQFVHVGFWHLLFNMLALLSFGPLMEGWWGRGRFLAFYLLCGISGAVLFSLASAIPGLLGSHAGMTPIAGASGSIFGILVGCAMVAPDTQASLLFLPVTIRMRTLALAFLVIAVLSLLAGSQNAGGEAAHLGGAALGFALVKYPWLLDFSERLHLRRWWRRARPGRWQRQQERLRRREEAEQSEVDRILDKVRDHGIHSLTRGEKKILQRATDRQRRAG